MRVNPKFEINFKLFLHELSCSSVSRCFRDNLDAQWHRPTQPLRRVHRHMAACCFRICLGTRVPCCCSEGNRGTCVHPTGRLSAKDIPLCTLRLLPKDLAPCRPGEDRTLVDPRIPPPSRSRPLLRSRNLFYVASLKVDNLPRSTAFSAHRHNGCTDH